MFREGLANRVHVPGSHVHLKKSNANVQKIV